MIAGTQYRRDDLAPVERWLMRYLDARADAECAALQVERLDAYAKRMASQIVGTSEGCEDLLPDLCSERGRLLKKAQNAEAVKREIEAAIALLPSDYGRLLTMHFLHGLSWEAASEFVPCSRSTAFRMRERALRMIGEKLGLES